MSTFTVRGEGLDAVDSVLLEGPSTPAVTIDSATSEKLRFTTVPSAAGDYTVVLKAGTQEVHREVAAFTVIAEPTVPTILYVDPAVTIPGTQDFKIVGWLLDAADCLGWNFTGQGGGTNWSGLDIGNTGVTVHSSLAVGVWDVHAKQGGSGGPVIASKTAATEVTDYEVLSFEPDTATAGTATTYTLTLNAGAYYIGVVKIKDATTGVAQPDIAIPPDGPSDTVLTFQATLPAGTYDVEFWYWSSAQLLLTLPDAITVT